MGGHFGGTTEWHLATFMEMSVLRVRKRPGANLRNLLCRMVYLLRAGRRAREK
jgi:hypothetical protein